MDDMFCVQPIRLHYQVLDSWKKPDFMGSRLRGMFGHALSTLSCQQEVKSNSCLNISTCAYHQVFAPHILNTRQLPPPFILHPPPLGEKLLHAGESFNFTQLLFPLALPWLPHVLQAWSNAQFPENNIEIRFIKAELLNKQNEVASAWQAEAPFPLPQPFTPKPIIKNSDSITLKLITPLHLREKNKDIRPDMLRPEHIVMGAVRRIKLTIPNWQELFPELNLPPEALQAWAKTLKLDHKTHWKSLKRWSNSQKQEIPISGILGELTLQGNLDPFSSALHLLPYLSLGKNCNFGLGQIEIK